MLALPETGRTHQIRVHAAVAGHPIAGDAKYGRREFDAACRERGLRRLFLHCESMTVEHPPGHRLVLEAPLPAELAAVAAAYGLDCPAVRSGMNERATGQGHRRGAAP